MRRLAVIALTALILLMPPTTSAFPLTDCTLELTSPTARLMTMDTAIGGRADSTQADPFLVYWGSSVTWAGTTGNHAIKDSSWRVSVFGIPTPLGGSEANPSGKLNGDGSVYVGVNLSLPFRVAGLFYVTGWLSGSGGSCSGRGWVRLVGDPFGSMLFWLGLVLILLGLLALWRGWLRSSILGALGGVLLGLGAAAMLITYGLTFAGQWTPLAAFAAGVFIGLVVAIMRPEPV